MSDPRVSIILPTFDRGWCIDDAVRSALQAGGEQAELIVVDDGSKDDTGDRLHAWTERSQAVRVLRHPKGVNLGIARSRNLGIREARAPLLAFVDSDDLLLPSRFHRALDWLDANPRCEAVLEPVEVESAGVLAKELHLTTLASAKGEAIDALGAMLEKQMFWTTPCITVRRQALLAVGGFDESLAVGEDTACWLRLAARGGVAALGHAEPVARVRRHDRHSWSGIRAGDAFEVFLLAMLGAAAWAARADSAVAPTQRARLLARIGSYLRETLGHPDLGRRRKLQLFLATVRQDPAALLDARLLARLASATLGRGAARASLAR